MPKPFQYGNGSLIYCKGEDADKIYILQSGKVSLVFTDIETGNDVRNQVEPGEFFGVKSALGRFSREENAIALADSTLMVFTVPEFEKMAMTNTRVILKMLKVFSTQMRKTHAQVSSLLDVEEVKPDEGLFAIGEKYLKNKRYAHAKYVFSRYLVHYPSGERVNEAAKNLRLADAAFANTGEKKSKHEKTSNADNPPPSASFARFTRIFQPGEIIFSEYEPGDIFYLIKWGRIKLIKNTGEFERTLDILQPSEVFGEMAILENAPRSATAIAVDQVEVLEFNAQNFELLILGNPQIAIKLLRIFSKRIYDSKRRFMILTLPAPQSKVADVFLMLDETRSNIDKTSQDREFHTTVEDIAHWAGMGLAETREILSRSNIDKTSQDREFYTTAEDIAHWAGMSLAETRDVLSHFAAQHRLEMFPDRIVVKNINAFSRLVNTRRNHD